MENPQSPIPEDTHTVPIVLSEKETSEIDKLKAETEKIKSETSNLKSNKERKEKIITAIPNFVIAIFTILVAVKSDFFDSSTKLLDAEKISLKNEIWDFKRMKDSTQNLYDILKPKYDSMSTNYKRDSTSVTKLLAQLNDKKKTESDKNKILLKAISDTVRFYRDLISVSSNVGIKQVGQAEKEVLDLKDNYAKLLEINKELNNRIEELEKKP